MEQESAGGTGDQWIAAAIAAGDRDGLAVAYDTYAAELFEDCRYLLRDPYRAADAVQDTFLVAWQHIGRLRDPSRLGAWLSAIARNECKRTEQDGDLFEEERPRTGDGADVPLPEPLKEQIMLLLDEPGGQAYAADVAARADAWRRDGFPQPLDGRYRAYSAAGTVAVAGAIVVAMVVVFLILAQPTAANKHTNGNGITQAQSIGPAPVTSLPPPLTPPPPPTVKPTTTTPTPSRTPTPTPTHPKPSKTPTPIPPGVGAISVSPTTLTIPVDGSGSFTVSATGGSAVFTVSSSPYAFTSPSSGVVSDGQPATVTVFVTGAPPSSGRRRGSFQIFVNGIAVTIRVSAVPLPGG